MFNPENGVTGVSFYDGGGWWDGPRPNVGFKIQHSEHWAFAKTGLHNGDLLGASGSHPLVGYEADGAEVVEVDGVARPTGARGTPRGFAVLGVAEFGQGWEREMAAGVATLGTYTSPNGGVVFQGATTDWPLAMKSDETLTTITRTVIEKLALGSVRVLGPFPCVNGEPRGVRGEKAQYAVDLGDISLDESAAFAFEWDINGTSVTTESPLVEFAIADSAAIVTVSVTVTENAVPVRFGSTTFYTVSPETHMLEDIAGMLRDMVMPGDPSQPLVIPTGSPSAVAPSMTQVNLDLFGDRARSLIERLDDLARLRNADQNADQRKASEA